MLSCNFGNNLIKRQSETGADLGGGHRGHVPSPRIFSQKKIPHKQKIQKHNINKICQIELRLKEMTCLMIIPKTKKTFSAFQFFH